jgi:lysine 2,3-aminomutase
MNDWQQQLEHCDEALASLGVPGLALAAADGAHPARLTSHLARLIAADPTGPVARQFLPDPREMERRPEEREDSVAEEPCKVADVLIHAYPDRALLMCTQECAAYCRFCFRKRLVGQAVAEDDRRFEAAFDYLRAHPEIQDVILSGGDPLILSDERLDFLLRRLAGIPSVRVVRIHTRILTALPQRVTPELCDLLSRHDVKYVNCHINHPDELTEEALVAAIRLRRAGVSLGSQTVLLKGVNDDLETMRELCLRLYHAGIQPYYLFHCEYVAGCAHFRPSLAAGRAIWHGLQGWISGMAVPRYVLDTPTLRKIPLYPSYAAAQPDGTWHLRNFQGRETVYREPHILE